METVVKTIYVRLTCWWSDKSSALGVLHTNCEIHEWRKSLPSSVYGWEIWKLKSFLFLLIHNIIHIITLHSKMLTNQSELKGFNNRLTSARMFSLERCSRWWNRLVGSGFWHFKSHLICSPAIFQKSSIIISRCELGLFVGSREMNN